MIAYSFVIYQIENLSCYKGNINILFTDHGGRGNSGGAGGQGGRTPPVVLIDDLCEGIFNYLETIVTL